MTKGRRRPLRRRPHAADGQRGYDHDLSEQHTGLCRTLARHVSSPNESRAAQVLRTVP
ncbi:hypothetical protein AB6N01_16110 [Alcaligenes nematophilus]|uniref:hypothetical protein n=1 Tax=Alcaligenes nematophilus TaxID=2994643 RepID=UPI0034E0D24C